MLRITTQELANRFGCSIRTIKRMTALGRDTGDPPPWDNPTKLADWYAMHHSNPVPAWLEKHVVKTKSEQQPAVPQRNPSPASPAADPGEVDQIAVARQIVANRQQDLEEAERMPSEAEGRIKRIRAAQDAFLKAQAHLIKVERVEDKALALAEGYMAQVKPKLSSTFGSLLTKLCNTWIDLIPEDKIAEAESSRDKILIEFRDSLGKIPVAV